MHRVVHFEIPADHPERLMKFYGELLGWQFHQFGEQQYWLVVTGPHGQPRINGGLLPRQPGATTVNTVAVASVDQAVKTAEAKGGKNVAPKMTIPGVGYAAYCADPDGNVFGVFQDDKSAR